MGKTKALPLGVEPRQGAVAVGIGLVGAAAFPPLTLWPLSLVAIALLLLLLKDKDTLTARNLGLVFGLTYALGTMYWFFALFGLFAVPMIGLMAGYFGLLATLIAMTRDYRPILRAALVAAFAVGIEWIRGDAWYLRFPWYTPVHALAAEPWSIAPVRWFGTYGFSYLLWLFAAAGAYVHPGCWVGFLLIPVGIGATLEIETADRRVLLVQAEEVVEEVIPRVPPQAVDLAVLPEYAYFRSPKGALTSPSGPATLAKRLSCPVVFGAVEGDYDSPKFFNVAAVIDADAKLIGTFPKQHPVPLMRDGKPGEQRPVFALPQGVLGVAICYDFDAPEVAASLVRAGATVLVAPTFDSMDWTAIQHVHHELLARLRAVENDRWLLRCASSGRSEVIDPHGVPSTQGIGIGETGYITLRFAHRNTFALGGRLWFLGPVAGAVTVLYALIGIAQFLRKRRARKVASA